MTEGRDRMPDASPPERGPDASPPERGPERSAPERGPDGAAPQPEPDVDPGHPTADAEPATGSASARRRRATVPVAIAVVAGVLAIFGALGSGGSDPPDGTATSPAAGGTPSGSSASTVASSGWMSEAHARREAGDPLAKGRVDAPVVLVEFSDFQCAFCHRWVRETAPAMQRYVDDGRLRIEWRDLPLLGEESVLAARAGRAAAAQGRFWEFHDRVFATPVRPNTGALSRDRLTAVARSIGLDVPRFRAAMDSAAVAAAVTKDSDLAAEIGFSGTPSFLLGDATIVGAQPTDSFTSATEQALALKE